MMKHSTVKNVLSSNRNYYVRNIRNKYKHTNVDCLRQWISPADNLKVGRKKYAIKPESIIYQINFCIHFLTPRKKNYERIQ